MNKLSTDERKAVVAALVEGNSLRAITRMTGVHRTTVMKLLCDLGRALARNIRTKHFGIFRRSSSSAMRFGVSFTRRKRIAERSTSREARATFGHGLRLTRIRTSC